jgi:flavin reductase (DIM6/NTAB) family NADH-FMN oxidoreductase RutF
VADGQAPEVAPAEFRAALSQFASGVTVVTSRRASGQPVGLTVSAFAAVSLVPPLVLVSIAHHAEAHPGFAESGVFGVSVLGEEQEGVSRRFAQNGPERFDLGGLHRGPRLGVVLVDGALARLECRVVAGHVAGDHTIFVGEIVALAVSPGRPLVYHHGAYARVQPPLPVGGAGGDRL